MSNPISDDQLSAYLDGACEPDFVARIERGLSEDGQLRRRLHDMRKNDEILRMALDAQLGNAVPEKLRLAIAGRNDAVRLPFVSNAQRTRVGRFVAQYGRQYGRMAAALLLAFGFGLALSQPFRSNGTEPLVALAHSGLAPGSALAAVMSSARSGDNVATPLGATSLLASFRTAKGNWCRQFRIDAGTSAAEGVACHEDGGWNVRALVEAGPRPASRASYAVAGGPVDPVISAVTDRLGAGAFVDQAEEAKAIASGWKDPLPASPAR